VLQLHALHPGAEPAIRRRFEQADWAISELADGSRQSSSGLIFGIDVPHWNAQRPAQTKEHFVRSPHTHQIYRDETINGDVLAQSSESVQPMTDNLHQWLHHRSS